MRTLLIFDIHQDLRWADGILEREAGGFDRLILGGDYFDTHRKELPGLSSSARWLLAIKERLQDQVTILLGNHDIQYVACSLAQPPRPRLYRPLYNCQSCFTRSAARKIQKVIPADFWLDYGRLFTVASGYLVSHAGVHRSLWPGSLEALEDSCRLALRNCSHRHDPLLAPGIHRGGEQPVGGLTWADWEFDFEDDPVLPPQIVGHTAVCGPDQQGRSWCLDGAQSCYGLLDEEGKLTIKHFQANEH